MLDFSIKDALDIVLMALLLYYVYKLMKESGTLNIFYGVMAFIVAWALASEIFSMKLIGSILDKFMSIGVLVLVILFQDQIKRFLVDLGSHKRWRFLRQIFSHHKEVRDQQILRESVMPIVYACMSMSKSKTGALIVIQQKMPLDNYAKSGDVIDAKINTRLIENIFFKNSPLHDGAMIIANGQIEAAGCILPVSHDTSIPRSLGLRHRSALGIAQATDAMAIIVSEETGNISVAYHGELYTKITSADLEHRLSALETPITGD
ncbi:MAG: diadenylate cyclase CdaA [Bacteroidales bacterium]|nr:diadenylate cyclase CdaA [Bacteroidales bacterium]